jgi:hypothetical protein
LRNHGDHAGIWILRWCQCNDYKHVEVQSHVAEGRDQSIWPSLIDWFFDERGTFLWSAIFSHPPFPCANMPFHFYFFFHSWCDINYS